MSRDRIVALIDMDCFYCQVEERANPSLRGKPVGVVQYNTWKGGGVIAVNYEARILGISRGMRGDEATSKCPEIHLISVPEVRGKADLSRYRNAGREVVAVLCGFSSCVEKASIDEAYVDLTDVINKREERISHHQVQNTFITGYSSDKEGTKQWLNDIYKNGINDCSTNDLARAAALVEKIRKTIYDKTEFCCSAGISHNKVLAKLACGLHKPNRQTVLPLSSVPILYESLPLKKIRKLGGKFGDVVRERLGVNFMGEVSKFSSQELQQQFGDKAGLWLYNISKGIDLEVVMPRLISKSIGCCKNFKGPSALTTSEEVNYWINELATEIIERLEDDLILNKRKATILVISAHQELCKSSTPFSRSIPLNNYNKVEIVRNTYAVLKKYNRATVSHTWSPALLYLGLSAGKFLKYDDNRNSLLNFFKPAHRTPVSETSQEFEIIELKDAPEFHVKSSEIVQDSSNAFVLNGPENSNSYITSENNNTEIVDCVNSFFCKYFIGRHLPEATAIEGMAKSYKIDEVDVLVTNTSESSPILQPKPVTSTSKCYYKSRENMIEHVNSSHSQESNSTFNADDLIEICSECKKPIKLAEFLDHLDHHVARKFHEEINAADLLPEIQQECVSYKSSLSVNKKFGTEKRKLYKSRSRNIPLKRSPQSLQITNFFSVKPPK